MTTSAVGGAAAAVAGVTALELVHPESCRFLKALGATRLTLVIIIALGVLVPENRAVVLGGVLDSVKIITKANQTMARS